MFDVCKGCGKCCETVVIVNPKTPDVPGSVSRYFKQLSPLKPHNSNLGHGFGFECSWFDKKTRTCKNYEERPYFCKSFICGTAIKKLALIANFPEIAHNDE